MELVHYKSRGEVGGLGGFVMVGGFVLVEGFLLVRLGIF